MSPGHAPDHDAKQTQRSNAMRALVVDDSRAMRGILKRGLAERGYEVREAADGQLALDCLAEGYQPELAMVDWNMPNLNGLEFVIKVRQNPAFAAMKIVMVTTEVEQHQMMKALDAGANEYLMKPFTPEALQEKLEFLLAGMEQL
jgi:two-component system chemotaxis response regulator CheY